MPNRMAAMAPRQQPGRSNDDGLQGRPCGRHMTGAAGAALRYGGAPSAGSHLHRARARGQPSRQKRTMGGDAMLGDHPITPVLLSKDLAATREFYHDRLGLEVLTENDDASVFGGGGR